MTGGTRGFLLLPVTLLLITSALAAFLLVREGASGADRVGRAREAGTALHVAKAGLEHLHWLSRAGRCSGDQALAESLGQHGYTASITTGATVAVQTFPASADTWLQEKVPPNTHGTDPDLVVADVDGNRRRAVLRFDVSSIAPGERIVSAVARLRVTGASDGGHLAVRAITEAWAEADASWDTHASEFNVLTWGAVPVDAADATVTVPVTGLVQAWVNDPTGNHGMMLVAPASAKVATVASREHGTASLRPVLEVTTATAPVSPVALSATGTLASGISRTVSDAPVRVAQPTVRLTVTPNGPGGRDTYIESNNVDTNKGAHDDLHLETSAAKYGLVRIDVAEVPPGARIRSAALSLHAETGSGEVAVYRLLEDWAEGTCDGGGCTADGATWNDRDVSVPWSTAGGHHLAAAESTATVTAGVEARWDVTGAVRDWVEGAALNHGLVLVPTSGGGIKLTSREHTDPAIWPRLTIEYDCECGTACAPPIGEGKLLLVIDDAASPGAGEQALIDRLSSWGFEVTAISDDADQASFETAVSANDVAYVAATVTDSVLGTRLRGARIGVVYESGALNDEMGVSSTSGTAVADSVDVVDATHEITRAFAQALVPVFEGAATAGTVGGTLAGGAQVLARSGGAGSLVVLESGAALEGGGSAAARRVKLPLGPDTGVSWRRLGPDGFLMVSRAIDWAREDTSCEGVTVERRIHASTDDVEEAKSDGYVYIDSADIEMIDDALTHGEQIVGLRFRAIPVPRGAQVQDARIVFAVDDPGSDATTLRLYAEAADDAPWFSTDYDDVSRRERTTAAVEWADVETWTTVGANHESPDIAPLLEEVFSRAGWSPGNALVILVDGKGVRSAAAFDRSPASAAQLRITLCGDPAELRGPLAHWKLDDGGGAKATDSVGGHHGKLEGATWGPGYLALDGDDRVEVEPDPGLDISGDMTLIARIKPAAFPRFQGIVSKGESPTKQNYWLGLQYNDVGFAFYDGTSHEVYSGGADLKAGVWVTIAATFEVATGAVRLYVDGSQVYSATRLYQPRPDGGMLRIGSDVWEDNFTGEIDDVRIFDRVLVPEELFVEGVEAATCERVADDFETADYSGSTGTIAWSGNWKEVNEADGPAAGDIRVRDRNGDLALVVADNDGGGEGVVRGAAIGGFSSGRLQLQYQRDRLDNADDHARLEISADGGATWTELDRYAGPWVDTGWRPVSYDITPHLSDETQIRIVTSATMGGNDRVWIDDVVLCLER